MSKIGLAAIAGVVVACAGVAFAALPRSAPTPAGGLDTAHVFRCDEKSGTAYEECMEAKDIVLFQCQQCHLFVRVVRAQFDEQGWSRLLARHRDRATTVSEEQFALLERYLSSTFKPGVPPPDLPEDLVLAQ